MTNNTHPSNLKVRRLTELPQIPQEEIGDSVLYATANNKDYKVGTSTYVDAVVEQLGDELAGIGEVRDEAVEARDDAIVASGAAAASASEAASSATASEQHAADSESYASAAEESANLAEQSRLSGPPIGYATRADMEGNTSEDEGALALVTNDPNPDNNGTWRWNGAAWVQSADRVSSLENRVDATLLRPPVESLRVPLFTDQRGAVPVWLEDGLLAAQGLSPGLRDAIGTSGRFAPANQPLDSSLPVATDGRSLWAWRAKLAKLAVGDTAQAKVVFTGDSWSEWLSIPAAMVETLNADGLTRSGLGWIGISGAYLADDLTLARSGFSFYDASSGAVPAYGTGIDGQYLSASTDTATLAIGNCRCTDFRLYYRKHGGTFRIRVDGGAWTSVVSDTSGELGIARLQGLPEGPHLFEVDTTGNDGTVVICGALATDSAPGYEVLKAGNGNSDGQQYGRFIESVSPIVADISPDVVVVILGTNDYTRPEATIERYLQALEGIVAAYRSGAPDCGFIFVAPADSSRTPARPLTQYRDAAYGFAVENGHEFYNMHDEWPGHSQADSAGLWHDLVHVNETGARLLANRLHKLFLEG